MGEDFMSDEIELFGTKVDLSKITDDSPEYRVKKKLLANVIFEIRHLPHFDMVYGKSKIINSFQGDYPNLLFYQGNNQLEDGIQMVRKDIESGLFWPRCQMLSFETKEYKSFDEFTGWITADYKKYHELFPIPDIHRVGLRYINRFPVDRLEDIPQKIQEFNLDLKFGNGNASLNLTSLVFTHIMAPGVAVTTRLGVTEAGTNKFLEWDNDIYVEGRWPARYATKFIPMLHSIATKMFLDLLTEKMKCEYIER